VLQSGEKAMLTESFLLVPSYRRGQFCFASLSFFSSDKGGGKCFRPCLSVCLSARLLENPTYAYWRGSPLQRRVVLKWFYSLSRRNTFVGGTCAPPSPLILVFSSSYKF